jgi:anti-anti-sigma factor
MTYTHQLQDNIAIFELEGSLLGENDREAIKNDFAHYLERDVKRFLIDLTNLKHINSTGLGTFITLYTKVMGKGGEMILCNPASNISNLLSITKLNTVFSIAEDKSVGLKTLRANS